MIKNVYDRVGNGVGNGVHTNGCHVRVHQDFCWVNIGFLWRASCVRVYVSFTKNERQKVKDILEEFLIQMPPRHCL